MARLGTPSLSIFPQHARRAVELKQMIKVLDECRCEMLGFETAPNYLPKFLSSLIYLCISHVIFHTLTTWEDFLISDSFLLIYILKNVLLRLVGRVANFQSKECCSPADGVELLEEHPGLLAPERKHCNEKGEAVLFF